MADEARAMLDALMGADRNASLAEKGISATSGRRGRSGGGNNSSGNRRRLEHDNNGSSNRNDGVLPPPRKKLKKSCYDEDICPYYTSWGIDVYDLFTNTKSDMGPNPCVVDADARAEYIELDDNEQEILGYERMLQRKLRDMVRRVDWTVTRNKQKLRQEIESKKSEGRVHVDPLHLTNVDRDKLDRAAQLQASKELVQDEISEWLDKLDELEQKEIAEKTELLSKEKENKTEAKDLTTAKEEPNDASLNDKEGETEKDHLSVEVNGTGESDPKDLKADGDGEVKKSDDNDAVNETEKKDETETIIPKENKDHEPTRAEAPSSGFVQEKGVETVQEGEDGEKLNDQTNVEEDVALKKKAEEIRKAEERLEEQLKLQREEQNKLQLLDTILSKMEQLATMTDDIQQSLKSLRYFRGDTAADKVVCDISGNFMSARDAEERIAAHYAGKQYQGWNIVRDKLKELDQKYRNKPPPRRPALLPHERESYKRDKDRGSSTGGDRGSTREDMFQRQNSSSSSLGRSGERGDHRYGRGSGGGGSSRSPDCDRHHSNTRGGGGGYRGRDGWDRYYDQAGATSRDGRYHDNDRYGSGRGGGSDGRDRGGGSSRGGYSGYDDYPPKNDGSRRYRDDRRYGGGSGRRR